MRLALLIVLIVQTPHALPDETAMASAFSDEYAEMRETAVRKLQSSMSESQQARAVLAVCDPDYHASSREASADWDMANKIAAESLVDLASELGEPPMKLMKHREALLIDLLAQLQAHSLEIGEEVARLSESDRADACTLARQQIKITREPLKLAKPARRHEGPITQKQFKNLNVGQSIEEVTTAFGAPDERHYISANRVRLVYVVKPSNLSWMCRTASFQKKLHLYPECKVGGYLHFVQFVEDRVVGWGRVADNPIVDPGASNYWDAIRQENEAKRHKSQKSHDEYEQRKAERQAEYEQREAQRRCQDAIRRERGGYTNSRHEVDQACNY